MAWTGHCAAMQGMCRVLLRVFSRALFRRRRCNLICLETTLGSLLKGTKICTSMSSTKYLLFNISFYISCWTSMVIWQVLFFWFCKCVVHHDFPHFIDSRKRMPFYFLRGSSIFISSLCELFRCLFLQHKRKFLG